MKQTKSTDIIDPIRWHENELHFRPKKQVEFLTKITITVAGKGSRTANHQKLFTEWKRQDVALASMTLITTLTVARILRTKSEDQVFNIV